MIFQFNKIALVAGVSVFYLVSAVAAQNDATPSTVGEGKDQGECVPIYTVSEYDPARKAADDLAATIKRARAEKRRIILEIGGQW